MLGIEAAKVVYVPRVACFDSFIEQPVYSWFDHACHDKRAIPLGLQFALLVRMVNDHHVSRVDVLS